MKKILVCLLFFAHISLSYADSASKQQRLLFNKHWGLAATVYVVGKTMRFELIDVPNHKQHDNVVNYWNPEKYAVMINGGYFDKAFNPVGYNKINNKVLNSINISTLSGFVGINKLGGLALLTRSQLLKNGEKINRIYPTLMQTGPYLIDPGGNVGIKKNNHKRYQRTVLAKMRSGEIALISTGPISLYDLAHALKVEIPGIERALNLDGGPSTAMMTATLTIQNRMPVRSYLAGFT